MFIFDQLKREDPALRLVSLFVLAGLGLLLGGLWWVQVVCGSEYQSHLEVQSYRTIRTPAPRGRILDRNGASLAENRPRYNVSLYLEELRKSFDAANAAQTTAARIQLKAQRTAREHQLGRKLTRDEAKAFAMSTAQRGEIRERTRVEVADHVIADMAARLQIPLALDPTRFLRHYATSPYQPFPVLTDLEPTTIARFEEQFGGMPGVELEMQSTRGYPFQTSAAHLLGYLRSDNSSAEGEESFFSYRLRDYRGVVGLEGGFDEELRGRAGAKSVLVNNLGYKQEENVWQAAEPGSDLVLTLDMHLQQAAEQALQRRGGPNTRGAAVVMDVRNGDILALASSPSFNPNYFIKGFPPGEWDRMNDPELQPQMNRATYGAYQPGSIFKIVVGLAALENGLNPEATYMVSPHPSDPGKGAYALGRRYIKDTAAPGPYTFRRAFAKSSNSYFIHCGLDAGVDRIVALARKLHLGESSGLQTMQDGRGIFPTDRHLQVGWSAGDTANLCIGQAQIAVTPLQMATMTSAIANGGTVFWPRIVQRIEPQDPLSNEPARNIEAGRIRDRLGVSPRSMSVIHDAMLADTEDPDGTGRAAALPGFRVGGKTGTAQVSDEHNRVVNHITWFVSYGPWENPRYAVVVMIEGGSSGGGTCAPVAHDIYEAIQKFERPPQSAAVAENQ
jgi:penicillin-binding protein 2